MHGTQRRCFGVWCAVTLAMGAVLALALPAATRAVAVLTGGAPLRLDEAVVAACGAVAAVAVTWLWVAASLVTLASARGRAPIARGIPAPVRHLLLAACGVALTGGLGATGVTAAGATPSPIHEQQRTSPGTSATLAGLPYPDLAAAALPVRASLQARVVAPGDTLWSIARDQLGPDASDTRTSAYVRTLYRLNRAVVGPDPDLIHPAQRLRMPPG